MEGSAGIRRRRVVLGALAALIALIAVQLGAAGAEDSAGTTARVSAALDGTAGSSGGRRPSISGDGRHVAFALFSFSVGSVFAHDRQTGTTTLLSVGDRPSISGDGRLVAFESAEPLVPGDTNGGGDVFVRDRDTDGDGIFDEPGAVSTTRVSMASDGTQANSVSYLSAVSPGARHVAFVSFASNLVDGDTNGVPDVFVRDLQAGTTARVSVAADGIQADASSDLFVPALSGDGRHVAFASEASNLVAGDTNGTRDVFVRDRQTSATTRVSVSSDGAQANVDSRAPAISGDGRYVAFASYATNLVPGDTNGGGDVFARDLQAGTTARVSVASDGSQSNGPGFGDLRPSISADGRYVGFTLDGSNLVPGDTNGAPDVFVRDRQAGTTTRVSVGSGGAPQANGESGLPSMNADGSEVAFESAASTLVGSDANGVFDVFVHDRGEPAPSLSVADATVAEDGPGYVDVTVRLSRASEQPVLVDYATADGTASADRDYRRASGTLTFAPGETAKTLTLVVLADALDEHDETFFVDLADPRYASVADGQASVTIEDDDPVASRLSVNDVSVPEGDAGTTSASFTVSLSTASGKPVTVSYATADGTATAGSDYVAAGGEVVFALGETAKTVTVLVNGDTAFEASETFFLDLSGETNALVQDPQGVGTIVDDEPLLSVSDKRVTEGDGGSTSAAFAVALSRPSPATVTVAYATADGTASAGSDYMQATGSVTFLPGETRREVSVLVHGDTLDEPDETFFLDLSGAMHAGVADGRGVGTIVDDDAPSSLSVSDVTVAEGSVGAAPATFAVTLSRPSGWTVTVDYATADASATGGLDYTQASGSLRFDPGQTRKEVSVLIHGDALDEPDETFFLDLSGAANAGVVDARGVGIIVDDDAPPGLSVSDPRMTEGDSGGADAVFVLALSAPSGRTVTADVATADGTATVVSDYAGPVSGTVSFLAGATSRTVTVVVWGDTLVEPHETFFLDVTGATNATVQDGRGIATIVNDDVSPPPSPPSPPSPQPRTPSASGQLAVTGFIAAPARPTAGGTFTARAAIARRDTGAPLRSGRTRCVLRSAVRGVRTTDRGFRRSLVHCAWRLPFWTAGKRLRGSIGVTSQGVQVRFPLAVAVAPRAAPGAPARRGPRRKLAVPRLRFVIPAPAVRVARGEWQLPDATVGQRYEFSFCVPRPPGGRFCGPPFHKARNPSGGVGRYGFRIATGFVPRGLRLLLQPGGVLRGVPEPGTEKTRLRPGAPEGLWFFTVCAEDNPGATFVPRQLVCRKARLRVRGGRRRVTGTLQERVVERPTSAFTFSSSGDGDFTLTIAADGSVGGTAEIERTWTMSGACSRQGTDTGTMTVNGTADFAAATLRMTFEREEPAPAPFTCGSLSGLLYSPTYRFTRLGPITLRLRQGGAFEDTRNEPCGPADSCVVRVTIATVG